MFSKFGEIVSAKIIMNKETNRHRGFGFVEMTTREQAEAAMKALHHKEILKSIFIEIRESRGILYWREK